MDAKSALTLFNITTTHFPRCTFRRLHSMFVHSKMLPDVLISSGGGYCGCIRYSCVYCRAASFWRSRNVNGRCESDGDWRTAGGDSGGQQGECGSRSNNRIRCLRAGCNGCDRACTCCDATECVRPCVRHIWGRSSSHIFRLLWARYHGGRTGGYRCIGV